MGCVWANRREQIDTESQNQYRIGESSAKKVLTSGLTSTLSLVIIFLLFHSESESFLLRNISSNDSSQVQNQIVNRANNLLNSYWTDPTIKLQIANILYGVGEKNVSQTELLKLEKINPMNLDVLNALTYVYSNEDNQPMLRIYLNKIIQRDPWNASAYLKLGLLEKQQGNFEKMIEIKNKISEIARNKPIANEADKLLVQSS